MQVHVCSGRMWRNVSWNSAEPVSLPEGMHKHVTGAYFKTPSIQSGSSTASTACPPSAESAGRPPPEESEVVPAVAPPTRRRPRSEAARQASTAVRAGATQQPPAVAATHSAGFRSRLSSISGALQHPKLARRLFSHHSESTDLSGSALQQHQQQLTPVQITTTIDSPHSTPTLHEDARSAGATEAVEQRLMSSSSGRRLSQLFLPQQLANATLLHQDPYASNELIPPHLLGLYGQPPLVGGSASPSGGSSQLGHRASWADISLFGRLSNVRPSVDSAFHSQMRHSFDARK